MDGEERPDAQDQGQQDLPDGYVQNPAVIGEQVFFVATQKGSNKISISGYYFNYQKSKKSDQNIKMYRCESYFSKKCCARIHVLDNKIHKSIGAHNHPPDGVHGDVLQVSFVRLKLKYFQKSFSVKELIIVKEIILVYGHPSSIQDPY